MKTQARYRCDLKDLVALLVKHFEIHEGIWGPLVDFGLGAVNVTDEATQLSSPSAVVAILKVGIQPFTDLNSMTVDAAEVNPKPRARTKPPKHGRKRK